MFNNYALVLLKLNQPEKALPIFREVRETYRRVVGDKHWAIGLMSHNCGEALRLLGKKKEAEAEFRRALAVFHAAYGRENPNIANTMVKLGLTTGDAQMIRDSLAMRRKILPKGHPQIARSLYALGDEKSLAEAVAIRRAALPGSPITARTESAWAEKLLEKGERARAIELLEEAIPVLRKKPRAETSRDRQGDRAAATREGEEMTRTLVTLLFAAVAARAAEDFSDIPMKNVTRSDFEKVGEGAVRRRRRESDRPQGRGLVGARAADRREPPLGPDPAPEGHGRRRFRRRDADPGVRDEGGARRAGVAEAEGVLRPDGARPGARHQHHHVRRAQRHRQGRRFGSSS